MGKSAKMQWYEEQLEKAKTHPYGTYTVLYDDGGEDQLLLTVYPGTHHYGLTLGFGGSIFQFRTPRGEIVRSNNCWWWGGRRSDMPKKLVDKFEVWKRDTTPVVILPRRRPSFNAAALTVLQDYPEHVKEHFDWGWQIAIRNGDHIHYDEPYNSDYSLTEALHYVTSKYMYRADDEVWIEPSFYFERKEEEEMCRWILENNLKRHDYTTMENMSAGRQNMPDGAGITDRTYDKEYKEWIEAQLA